MKGPKRTIPSVKAAFETVFSWNGIVRRIVVDRQDDTVLKGKLLMPDPTKLITEIV